MPTKNEIIEELYRTGFVDKYCRQKCINQDNIDDYIADVWCIICELDDERLQEWYKDRGIDKVRQVVGGIICRTCCSTKSQSYYKLVRNDVRNLNIKMANDKRMHYEESEGWNEF